MYNGTTKKIRCPNLVLDDKFMDLLNILCIFCGSEGGQDDLCIAVQDLIDKQDFQPSMHSSSSMEMHGDAARTIRAREWTVIAIRRLRWAWSQFVTFDLSIWRLIDLTLSQSWLFIILMSQSVYSIMYVIAHSAQLIAQLLFCRWLLPRIDSIVGSNRDTTLCYIVQYLIIIIYQ